MDVQKKLDEIAAVLQGARSMPMSASCVVNRAELLDMLNEVREALPGSLARAEELLGGREQLVEEARREAEQIVEQARNQRSSLISDTEVARSAQAEADRILAEARQESEQIRAEADDYVDSKLANFEVVLTKTIGSVDRGRDKLLGRDPGYGDPDDPHAGGPDDAPERSGDPHEQRRRADGYVEAQFQAFHAVLAKTLEAVGRGRQKLQGARPIDQLGADLEQQEEAGPGVAQQGSDDSYLADLADSQRSGQPQQAPVPHQQPAAAAYYGHGTEGQGYPQPDYGQPAYQQGYEQGYGQNYEQNHEQNYEQNYEQGYRQGYDQGYGQGQAPAYQPGYEQPDPGYGWEAPQPPHAPQDPSGYAPQAAALDETSLFDTSMIDMEQLRQYDEQGR